MIRVGLCGLGFMGRTHFASYERHRDVRVVALMDRDARRRRGDWREPLGNLPASWPQRVDMTDRRAYRTVEELIADEQVDLVDICLPTHLHAEAAIKALRAGKHVLCEKPMALTHRDCQRVVRAAERAAGYYMVAQCLRFWPQYVEIQRRVCSKRFGRPRSAVFRRLAAAPGYSSGNWLLRHELSGGALLDLHVHDVDFALYLFGKPKRVSARGTRGPSGGIDHVQALWDYDRDLVVALEGGWCFPPGYPFQMAATVRCEKATVEWVMSAGPKVVTYHRSGRIEQTAVKPTTGWDEQIDYFLDCIRRRRPPTVVTARSSAEAIRMVEIELQSVRTGRTVRV